MLKPADPPMAGPDEERPVGEIVHQLVEDGKAYAQAEIDLAKAIALAKADAFKLPAILFGAAFVFLQAAVCVLAVSIYLSLIPAVGPFLAGLLAFLIFGGAAGGLAWFGVTKLREGL